MDDVTLQKVYLILFVALESFVRKVNGRRETPICRRKLLGEASTL
jgi:hypothetical protein